MDPIVVLIYALALAPGLVCLFVPDIGPPGAVIVIGLGLWLAPWFAMLTLVVAVVAAIWFLAGIVYQAGGGHL
jgi:hypothetical protein